MRQNYFLNAPEAYAKRIENNAKRIMTYRVESNDVKNYLQELMLNQHSSHRSDLVLNQKLGTVAVGARSMAGLHTMNLQWKTPGHKILMSDSKPGSQMINIACQLSGNLFTRFAGIDHPMDMMTGTHNMVYLTDEGDTHEMSGNEEHSIFHLSIEKDFFLESISNTGSWADDVINRILQNKSLAAAETSFKITPKMYTLISKLNTINSTLSKLQYQSAALELLSLQLEQYASNGSSTTSSVSIDDQHKLYSLKVWLESNFLETQSLTQLSRQFCLNEFKLKKGFKVMFGNTVFGYIRSLRMQRAGELLLETRSPVDEIAYTLGYEHPQHFTKAFREFSGFAPLQYRKGN